MTLLIGIVLLLASQQVRIGNAGVIPNAAMVPPTILRSTMAPYSAEAADRGLEGAVTLEARIDVSGRVEVLRVIKSLGFGLDENAIAAVKVWEFGPALRNGAPVEVISQIDVPFNLRAANAFRPGPGIVAPVVLQRVAPQYTAEARSARLQGTVVLQALIKKDGTLDIVSVVRGLDRGLTESAVQALRQWRFTPGKKENQDVDISVNVEINFNLERN